MGTRAPELPTSSDARAELAPRRLGRYELIGLLAKGGMGEVYLARTRGLGGFERLVVIKCALPSLAERTQSLLLAEARLAATLQHSNIVQVHDVGTDAQTVFLAMEYLHGQDIRAVLLRSAEFERPLPLDQAIAIAIAVCAGLHYAHDKRDTDGSALEIVHRDVSPSNVFVTYDGGVKLIDFGIAKATSLPSETQVGTLKGKPGYMSPEQCRCEPLDRRSDVFCVGILIYELTLGRRAFRADNEYLLNMQIMDTDPARPTSLDPHYPVALEAIVMRALAKDRRARHDTALALQDELAAFASALRLDLSQLGLGRWMAALFAAELSAWRDAQRAGQSLVEHVIKRTTTTAAIIVDEPVGTVELASSTSAHVPPKPKRWWIAAAGGIVALTATLIVATSSSSGTGRDLDPVAPPTTAPAPNVAPATPPEPSVAPPEPSVAPPAAPVAVVPVSPPAIRETTHAATREPHRPVRKKTSPMLSRPPTPPPPPAAQPPTNPLPPNPDEPI